MKPLASLPEFGHRARPVGVPPKGKQVKQPPRTANYARIRAEVLAAVGRLNPAKQSMIPLAGTLPEIMVCLALALLDVPFAAQVSELGGRLRLGGGVVDVKVWMGSGITIVRVQGDYWHSLPERKLKDAVQWARLHALRYRVADIWEHDIYQAWVEGRLKTFVYNSVVNAT